MNTDKPKTLDYMLASYVCRLAGHKPSGLITGFRNEDGAMIQRCARCLIPIVSSRFRASNPLLKTIERGYAAEDSEKGIIPFDPATCQPSTPNAR